MIGDTNKTVNINSQYIDDNGIGHINYTAQLSLQSPQHVDSKLGIEDVMMKSNPTRIM